MRKKDVFRRINKDLELFGIVNKMKVPISATDYRGKKWTKENVMTKEPETMGYHDQRSTSQGCGGIHQLMDKQRKKKNVVF